jgi:CHAT domain-containing protein
MALTPDRHLEDSKKMRLSLLLLLTVLLSTSSADDSAEIKALIDTVYFQGCQNVDHQLIKSPLFPSDKPETAIKRLRQAIFFTQAKSLHTDNSVLEILYRLQWQLGEIFKSQENWEQASYAYQQAKQALEMLRKMGAKPSQTVYQQVYYGLVDILLTRYEKENQQGLLKDVVDTVELLKQAELENYFQDECLVTGNSDRVENHLGDKTAVFYPILFPKAAGILTRSVELLLISPNKKIRWIKPSDAWRSVSEDIEIFKEKVEAFRQALENPPREDPPGKSNKLGGEVLYQLLLKPIENQLKNIEILVFVPDGILRTIPLVALFDGEEFVVEKHYAVVTIPGLSLTKSVGTPLRKNPWILLGGMSHEVSLSKDVRFPRLSKTQEALRAIQGLFPDRSRVIQDEEFLISHLKQEMHNIPSNTIMHLHTHATFGKEYQDTFLLTYNTKLDKGDRLTMARLEDIFSIGELRHSPIELLTLGACETAKGDEQAALGLAGVAFKSGARSVLATLWRVDERFTSKLMEVFYERLKAGQSRVLALQGAQREIMGMKESGGEIVPRDGSEKTSSLIARYWAPFILIGNWF